MEHEVYVPFSVGSVRAALAERERVARCVPGLLLDAGAPGDAAAGELEGRLRVRIGGSTITYRGSLRLTPDDEGLHAEGTGAESRGDGSVRVSVTLAARLSADGEGTTLVCTGTAEGAGRLAEFAEKTTRSAGQRLLERFAASLGESIGKTPPGAVPPPAEAGPVPEVEERADDAADADDADDDAEAAAEASSGGGIGEPDDNERAIPGIPDPDRAEEDRTGKPQDGQGEQGHDGQADEHLSVFEADIPPSSLDPMLDAGDDAEDEEADRPVTAEAAHARRTMIGRSAEEVDHAPPRGRYAPIPAPEAAATTATLRWAAPAAAAVVAGAIVLTRTLRRRG
ncbi:SRPBCC domain-containing protein [Streptomyces sp. ODS28]|uniref:SRPBCC domain-containing protein n=1 Tax=Streptomyces sp. ODS28 TaxID=3136688 RepID=UPI0031E8E389